MIVGINWTTATPYENESIEVVASVDDDSEIALVLFEYYDGEQWRNLTMQVDSVIINQYSVVVPPHRESRNVPGEDSRSGCQGELADD